ncbi:hypothetical protein D3C76_1803780 [compost metagenome]
MLTTALYLGNINQSAVVDGLLRIPWKNYPGSVIRIDLLLQAMKHGFKTCFVDVADVAMIFFSFSNLAESLQHDFQVLFNHTERR